MKLSVSESYDLFDLNAPLSDSEKLLAGLLSDSQPAQQSVAQVKIKDIEEDELQNPPEKGVLTQTDDEYNQAYAHWTRCQAVVALRKFDEGWKAFDELILRAYVRARKAENKAYAGEDRDRSFALRLRERAAEDFYRFILQQVEEAEQVPRPASK